MSEELGIIVPGSREDIQSLKEQKARQEGWKPLEEFDGDPTEWAEAGEFLARGPLLREIKELKKHISKQREATDRDMQLISKQFAQMSSAAYTKALADLQAQRDIAIEDRDTAAVRQLDKEIDDVKVGHAQAQATVNQTRTTQTVAATEELNAWRGENKWFDSDKELQDEAVAIGVGYLAKNPNKTQGDMLSHVEDRIKKIYPEKFKQKEFMSDNDTSETPQKVESGNLRPSLGNKKGKMSAADLDDDERAVMKTLIKRGVLKEVALKNKRSEQEEFLAQLAERKAQG
jgi:hypothetical protein